MADIWRFIPYSVHDAADNMAIDEAILDAHLEGHSPPTLRVYGWQPPAVSIGYGQKLSSAVEERIRSRGFEIVRRPTGGRAVLHAHELTYSFVGRACAGSAGGDDVDAVLSESVVKAYKEICEGLIQAFRELGLELSLGTSSSEYRNAHDCFLATTSADLHYKGKKMIGSAQLRRRNAVLQHGSILLNQPQDLMRSLLRESAVKTEDASANGPAIEDGENGREPGSPQPAKAAPSGSPTEDTSAQRHANLFEVMGEMLSTERLQEALRLGFEHAFERKLNNGALNTFETDLSQKHRLRYQLIACSSK